MTDARQAQPTDDLLERASSSFDVFASLGAPDPAGRAQFTSELEAAAARDAGCAARVYATDDGRAFIEHLLDVSLRRPVWTGALGLSMENAYGHGVLREGQNSLAFYALGLIARGRDEQKPQRGTEALL